MKIQKLKDWACTLHTQNNVIAVYANDIPKNATVLLHNQEFGSNAFEIHIPWEYDKKSDSIQGIPNHHAPIYAIDTEDMHIAYIPKTENKLSAEQIDKLKSIDILILPLDGEIKTRIEIIEQLEPKVLIPIPGEQSWESLFAQYQVSYEDVSANTLTLNESKLPAEPTKVFALA